MGNLDLYTATDPEPYLDAMRHAGPAELGSPSAVAADLARVVYGVQVPTPVITCPDCGAQRTGGEHKCLPGLKRSLPGAVPRRPGSELPPSSPAGSAS